MTAIIATVRSDAHTWNLVYLQLLLQQNDFTTHIVGPCSEPRAVVRACRQKTPTVLVMSTVNGHGYIDAPAFMRTLSLHIPDRTFPVVVGGMLGINEADERRKKQTLLACGFDAVFTGATSIAEFLEFIGRLTSNSTHSHGY